jgi:hypothetical protein
MPSPMRCGGPSAIRNAKRGEGGPQRFLRSLGACQHVFGAKERWLGTWRLRATTAGDGEHQLDVLWIDLLMSSAFPFEKP